MQPCETKSSSSFHILFLFAGLLFLCYSNTFNSSWQFDDIPNIVENYPLQIDNLRPETLWHSLFVKPFHPGTMERPVAFLSFALNWYFGQDNTFGYHIFNLFVHILTAFFLYKSTFLLLQSRLNEQQTKSDIIFIAILCAALWAINPIQTQAVTYIVQRMASMAAMFFLMAIYNYIRARQSQKPLSIIIHITLCTLFFLLAMGCKENAITLIPSLLLIEFLFFYKTKDYLSKISFIILIGLNVVLLTAFCFYVSNLLLSHGFTMPYGDRPFSLKERLLTQPAVLLFYISLILYPSPTRLSIEHSFPISTSLLHPWTTLPAIFFILGIIIFSIWQGRRRPLLSLAILFFFINHLVESTIIPLELLFEHRNYLPSFFLFLPLAAGIHALLNKLAISSRVLYGITLALVPALIIILGISTYTRNIAWATQESLWVDSLNKAPENARPYAKVAEVYGWKKEKTPENLNTALALLHKSLERESPRATLKATLLDNIGKIYAGNGHLDQAISYYNDSLQLNPDFLNSRFDLTQALIRKGDFINALEQINLIIVKNELQSRFYNVKGIILLWLNRPLESAECFRQATLRVFVDEQRYYYNIGVALGQAGYMDRGEWFIKMALQNHPENIRFLYSLIENRLLAGKDVSAKKYTNQLLKKRGIISIKNDLESMRTDYEGAPVNSALITKTIFEAANESLNAPLQQQSLQKIHSIQ